MSGLPASASATSAFSWLSPQACHQSAAGQSNSPFAARVIVLAAVAGARGSGAGPSLGGTAQAASAAAMNRVESERRT